MNTKLPVLDSIGRCQMNRERKRNRLKNYDYSKPGCYFITICVHPDLKRHNVFGVIKNGKMDLNKYGQILSNQWLWISEQYKHILLDEWVIMPDHFHGIVKIINIDENAGNGNVCVGNGNVCVGNGNVCVGNGLKPFPTVKHYGLPEIIRGFKTFSSRGINKINHNTVFRWQKSYYDHIVRDDNSLNRIRQYIINNPVN